MQKDFYYNIHASFLVPAYEMPVGMDSTYVATQNGYNNKGSIAIDVWFVRANRENTKQSMIESLQKEEAKYKAELEKISAEEKSENDDQKSDNVRRLEHGKKVFSNLCEMAQNNVYHKQPDAQFLDIAHRNLENPSFSKYKLDLKNYMYLAGLSYFEER